MQLKWSIFTSLDFRGDTKKVFQPLFVGLNKMVHIILPTSAKCSTVSKAEMVGLQLG
nr:MAG TPA: hypothetical protein [Caudoviricetes sp.]DAT68311.1 MAG TPA: hypothetical protein [Caudoviricetes sp.]